MGWLKKTPPKGGKTSVRDLSIERMTTQNNCIVNLLKWIFFITKAFISVFLACCATLSYHNLSVTQPV